MGGESGPVERKPICVVVDTSVWRGEPLLKTPLGKALVYALSRQKGFLGLPEVVESELTRQIVAAGMEAAGELRGPAHMIRTLTDDPFFPELPTRELLERKVAERLAQLGHILKREAFTLDHAKAALEMVNAKVAPNQHNQQFKDSAIWRSVLTLARDHTTHFVTRDKAFFDGKDVAKGMAGNLMDDCWRVGVTVGLHNDLATCLTAITKDEPSVDRAELVGMIEPLVLPSLTAQTQRQRFKIGLRYNDELKAFHTADANVIAVDYTLTYQIEDDPPIDNSPRAGARAVVHGSCNYNSTTHILEEHFIQQVTFGYKGMRSIWTPREYDDWAPVPRPIEERWEW